MQGAERKGIFLPVSSKGECCSALQEWSCFLGKNYRRWRSRIRSYVDPAVPDDSIRGAGYWHFGLISSVWYLCGNHREDASSTSRSET